MKKQFFAIIIIAISALTAVSSHAQSSFHIWKTIQAPGTLTTQMFFDSAQKKGIYIPSYSGAKEVLENLILDTTAKTVDLVVVTGEDLGLIDNPDKCIHIDAVIAKARELGLKPCPASAALQLCLEKKTFSGELITKLGTEEYNSVTTGIGSCGESQGKFVISVSGMIGPCYRPNDKFIFMLIKKY